MPCFTVALDPSVEMFYRRIAAQAELPLESVLSDALFKLAGELSLEAISRRISDKNRQKRHCFFSHSLLYSIQNVFPQITYERKSGVCHEITSRPV